MTELEVQLTANIKKLESQLKKAESKVKGFNDGVEKSLSAIDSKLNTLFASALNAGALNFLAEGFVRLFERGDKLSTTLRFLSIETSAFGLAQEELARAQSKNIGSAQSQITTLNILLDASRNLNKSEKERQEAIDRINQEYSQYLPNLTLENVGKKNLIEATNELTKSLIREAKIKGAQSLIAKETEKILEEQSKSALNSANGWDVLAGAILGVQSGTSGIQIVTKGLQRQQKVIEESENKIKSFTDILKNLLNEDLGFDRIKDIKLPKIKLISAKKINLSDLIKLDQSKITGIFVDPVRKELLKLGILLDQQPTLIAPKLTRIQEDFTRFNETLSNVFSSDAIANSISTTFNNVGAALAQGASLGAALGQSIIGAFGNFLSSFGQQLVAYGTASLAFATVSKGLLNPITAGPSALAAIAIGAALSVAGGALSSLASGGLGGGESVGGQGSRGGFAGGTAQGGSFSSGLGGGKVVFEIQGQKLVGVLNNTLGGNKRLGGNLGLG